SAQEITGSGSIIVAIAAEWMISTTGLGYVINRAMQQYRGDQVYAVAFLAAILSFAVYALLHFIGERLNWQAGPGRRSQRGAGRARSGPAACFARTSVGHHRRTSANRRTRPSPSTARSWRGCGSAR